MDYYQVYHICIFASHCQQSALTFLPYLVLVCASFTRHLQEPNSIFVSSNQQGLYLLSVSSISSSRILAVGKSLFSSHNS